MTPELTPDTFRKACGHWTTGVAIVTTIDVDGKPYGLTMNAVTSLSLTPPLFLICVDNRSDTLEPLRRSGVFCINVLAQGQQDLCMAFAKKGENKFDKIPYASAATGAPILAGHLMAMDCEVTQMFEGGDHKIFVGEVKTISLNEDPDSEPLIYYRGSFANVDC